MKENQIRVDPVREIAVKILTRIHAHQGYLNIILNQTLEKERVNIRDAALINELTYGVVRNRHKLDWIINQFARRESLPIPIWIKNILRTGVYQLLFLNKIPDYAACNESVQLAKKYGNPDLARFVNSILRNILRKKNGIYWPDKEKEPILYLSMVYSHPEWVVERWLKRFGWGKTLQICEWNNTIPPLVIRTNSLKISPPELKKIMEEQNIMVREGIFIPEAFYIRNLPNITSFFAYSKGYFQIQDEASMLVSHLLSPLPGEMAIDVCSAPGGKTTHLAQLMNNQGVIFALDLNPGRLSVVKENCRRLGIKIVKTKLGDATKLSPEFLGKADKVLVDVPCLGLGVLRRKPDLKWQEFTIDRLRQLSQVQFQILSIACQYVKVGGSLVYSTCSTEPEENEEVINRLLNENQNFDLEDISAFLQEKGLSRINLSRQEGCLQIFPGLFKLDLDGFFMAKLVRKR